MPNYKATIIGNGLQESKTKKTPSIHLQVRCDIDLEKNEHCDKVLYADLWLSDNAQKHTIDTLRAIGYDGGFAELNTPVLVGYEVEITTFFEDYNGKSYEKVNFVNAVGSFANRGVKPLDENVARGLSARYEAMFRNTKATNKPSINQNVNNQGANAPATAPANNNPYSYRNNANQASPTAPGAPNAPTSEELDGLPF